MIIAIPASPGEALDKLAIRYTKLARAAEHGAAMHAVSERLLEVEDALRENQRRGSSDVDFVELARAAYRANHQRAAIKRAVNDLLGRVPLEGKSFAD